MNDTKYSPLPSQEGQNRIFTSVYCEDMADCASKVYNYLVSCKQPKLAVLVIVLGLTFCFMETVPSLL